MIKYKKTITVRLTINQWKRLRNLCFQLEMSQMEFIRSLLAEGLRGVQAQKKILKIKREVEGGERAGDVGGVGKGVEGEAEVLLQGGERDIPPDGGVGV